jgi:hypothetical protein
MPPKKHPKSAADEPSASTGVEVFPTPKAVSVVSDQPPIAKHIRSSRSANAPPPTNYESPLKKLKKTLSKHPPHNVIDTIDGTSPSLT